MSRVARLVGLFGMLVALLAACGQAPAAQAPEQGAATPGAAAASAVVAPSSAATEPVKITMWHISTAGDAFAKVLPGTIERYNAAHPDIQFEAQAIELEAFKTQLQIAASANNQPDTFQTWGGGVLKSYVDAGVAREIPELSGEAGKKFIPSSLNVGKFGEKYYLVPASFNVVVLWYNKDLFAEHNVELPTTWSKFITACTAFKEKGVVPMAFGNKALWPGGHWFSYVPKFRPN